MSGFDVPFNLAVCAIYSGRVCFSNIQKGNIKKCVLADFSIQYFQKGAICLKDPSGRAPNQFVSEAGPGAHNTSGVISDQG